MKSLKNKSARELNLKQVKKLQNKLKKVSDLTARNRIIRELNLYLQLTGSTIQYKPETQEDQNLFYYNNKLKHLKNLDE